MKKYMAGAVAGALALTATSLMAAAETVEKWTLTGFEHPESVDLDVPHQVLYVSNIGKSPDGVAGPQPLAKDGNGFISKLSRDGKPIALKWVEGLDAPKGMVMKDYTLWVTDIDRLVEIDTRSGKITNTYPAEGSVFLNDPAVDAKGNVYVSDIAKRKIWKLENGKMSMWYDDDSLMHINGLRVIYGGKLLVAGWGRGMHDDGSTDSPGNLFTIDLKTKEVTNLRRWPAGRKS